MIAIYLNSISTKKVQQEVNFCNYLLQLPPIVDSFFKKFCSDKKLPKILQRYEKFLTNSEYIIIPKNIENIKLSISDKHFLRHPELLTKYSSQFDKFVDIIHIQDANLVNLDKELSRFFKYNLRATDPIFILNKDPRLQHFTDIVYGINSPKIKYLERYSFQTVYKILTSIIKKAIIENSVLKDYLLYYTLGTTAISTKGLTR